MNKNKRTAPTRVIAAAAPACDPREVFTRQSQNYLRTMYLGQCGLAESDLRVVDMISTLHYEVLLLFGKLVTEFSEVEKHNGRNLDEIERLRKQINEKLAALDNPTLRAILSKVPELKAAIAELGEVNAQTRDAFYQIASYSLQTGRVGLIDFTTGG